MTTETKCIHHWIIATSSGPVSRGLCKKCKSARDFQNTIFIAKHQISLAKERSNA